MQDIEKLSKDEWQRLCGCATQREWNSVCDAIKAARDGSYPPDWFPIDHLSGLMSLASKLPVGGER
jgi:hypothetical protein